MNKKLKNITAIFLVLFSTALMAQHDFTVTKTYLGENQTMVRVENELGNYAEYFVPQDISIVDFNYVNITNTGDPLTVKSPAKTIDVIDPDEKINCIDIYYSEAKDKVYISGGEKLNIYNPTDLSLVESITLLDQGSPESHGAFFYMPKQKFIAENSDGSYIFVSTRNNALYVINADTYAIETSINDNDYKDFVVSDIIYEPSLDRIYFIKHCWEYTSPKVTVINATTFEIINEVVFVQFRYMHHFTPFDDGSKLLASYEDDTGNGIVWLDSDLGVLHYELLDYNGISSTDNSIIIANNKVFVHSFYYLQPNEYSIIKFFNLSNYTYLGRQFVEPGPCFDIGYSSSLDRIYYLRRDHEIDHHQTYLTVLDAATNQVLSDEFFNDYNLSYFEIDQMNNVAYIGSYNSLKKLNLETMNIDNEGDIKGCLSFDIEIKQDPFNTKVFSANTFDGTISTSSSNCQVSNIKQCEANTFIGCFNRQNNKVYFINSKSNYEKSELIIITDDGNIIDRKIIGSDLTDVEYNENSNKVFVCSSGDNLLKVVNGTSNDVIHTITMDDRPMRLLSHQDYVYIQTYGKFYRCNANTYEVSLIEEFPEATLQNIYFPDMIVNNDIVYAAYTINGYGHFSYGFNTVTEEDYISEINTSLIYDIECNIITGEIYLSFYDGIIKIYDKELIYVDYFYPFQESEFATFDLKYDKYNNKLYIYKDRLLWEPAGLAVYDVTDQSITILDAEQIPNGIFFNPTNDQMYLNDVMLLDKNEVVIKVMDGLNDNTMHNFNTGNFLFNGLYFFGYFHYPKPVFIEDENRIFFGNGAFSNITMVDAFTDTYTIRDGWTWLSFPRLERYQIPNNPQEPQPVLSRIYEFPKDLIMWGEQSGGPDNYIEYNYPVWSGLLDELQSTEGYKLQIDLDNPLASPNFEFHGGKLSPDYPLTLHAGENWKGYFVEYDQWVEDCIPPEVLEKLTMIKTQDWTLIKAANGSWVNFGMGQEKPLKYGDMVILDSKFDQEFSWVESGEQASSSPTPDPEFYSYTEQSDYLPIFIEIDEGSDIQEIAVLADGEVKGAIVVPEDETLVEVNAYLQGTPPDAEITFETWSEYKSSPVTDEYLVYNPTKEVNEKRTIYAGEHRNYHRVSLKQGESYVLPDIISDVSCYPNPFSENTNISFRLEEDTYLKVEIMDLSGKNIFTLFNGEAQSSYYHLSWNGKDVKGSKVSKGVYFYKISTGNGDYKTGRIVVLD